MPSRYSFWSSASLSMSYASCQIQRQDRQVSTLCFYYLLEKGWLTTLNLNIESNYRQKKRKQKQILGIYNNCKSMFIYIYWQMYYKLWNWCTKNVTVGCDSQISVWRLWWPGSQPAVCFQHPACRPQSHDLENAQPHQIRNETVVKVQTLWSHLL